MAHQEQSTPAGKSVRDKGGPADAPRTVKDGMLKSVTIRNFRVFDELSIDHLSRVNLIAGRNNAGKTSLLEALFLLAGGGNPQMALNSNVIRGSGLPMSGPRDTLRETYWKPLFAGLDTDKVVEILGVHATRGPLTLHMSLERPNVVNLPLEGQKELSVHDLQREPTLLLSFKGDSEPEVEGRVRVVGEGVQATQSADPAPLSARDPLHAYRERSGGRDASWGGCASRSRMRRS